MASSVYGKTLSSASSFAPPKDRPMSLEETSGGADAAMTALVQKKLPHVQTASSIEMMSKVSAPPPENAEAFRSAFAKNRVSQAEIKESKREESETSGSPPSSPRLLKRAHSAPNSVSTTKRLEGNLLKVRKSVSYEKAEEKKAEERRGYTLSTKEETTIDASPRLLAKYGPKPSDSQFKTRNISISIYNLIEKLPHFLAMRSALIFDTDSAEKELSTCLKNYPAEMNKILDIVLDVGAELKSRHPHRLRRLRDVLILSSLKPENAPFLSSYFTKAPQDIEIFSSEAVKVWVKRKNKHSEIIQILSTFTQADLEREGLENLLSETCLSSALCQKYGTHLWSDELKQLSENIPKKFKETHPSLTCLKRDFVVRKLKEEDPQFGKVFTNDYEIQIGKELVVHAECFIVFAHGLLKDIYAMKLPVEFEELLQMQRFQIRCFLNRRSPAKKGILKKSDLSRKYIADLLFLRILNPYFLKTGKTPEEKDVLSSLTNVLECLAHEVEFGEEKGVLQKLNPLLNEFFEKHCHFFDLHTKPIS